MPYYIAVFAAGNFAGALLLSPLFDIVGRKPMIAGTYLLSGVLLIVTGLLFKEHQLDDISFTACICVVFFFASAGASAAYLTVSEVFPMETRALCIAVFYAVGTGIGGVIGPQVFSRLINTESYEQVFLAFGLGAVMMIIGGIAELFFGVKAERRSLENIAKPLTAAGPLSAKRRAAPSRRAPRRSFKRRPLRLPGRRRPIRADAEKQPSTPADMVQSRRSAADARIDRLTRRGRPEQAPGATAPGF